MVPRPEMLVPSTLSMPLRDVLRGLRGASVGAEELLEPAGKLVPGPLRDIMRSVMHAAEDAGREVLQAAIPTADEIADAAAYTARDGPRPERRVMARVLTYGIESYLGRYTEDAMLVSETVTAVALQDVMSGPAPEGRAAGLVAALIESAAIGPAPGTPLSPSGEDAEGIHLASFATVLWLLVERAEMPEEEAALLDLCGGLTHSLRDEVLAAIRGEEGLSEKLSSLADIV
ncbi:MAG: hypothetical protein AAF245_02750 [Pseudomonadota bacterium]